MHNTLAVGVGQCCCDLCQQPCCRSERQCSIAQATVQRATVNHPHNEIDCCVFTPEVVDGQNMCVLQLGDQPRLMLETRDKFGAARQLVADDFDGDISIH